MGRQGDGHVVEFLHAPERREELGQRIGLGGEPADVRGDRRQLDLKEFNADPQPDWVPDLGAAWHRVHRAR